MLAIPIIALILSASISTKCIDEKNFDGAVGWITVSIINIITIVNILSA